MVFKTPPTDHSSAHDAAAIVHTTMCHRYVVTFADGRASPTVCRSLRQVYDLLNAQAVDRALLAQRTSYDEMVGQSAVEGISYLSLPVPKA